MIWWCAKLLVFRLRPRCHKIFVHSFPLWANICTEYKVCSSQITSKFYIAEWILIYQLRRLWLWPSRKGDAPPQRRLFRFHLTVVKQHRTFEITAYTWPLMSRVWTVFCDFLIISLFLNCHPKFSEDTNTKQLETIFGASYSVSFCNSRH